MKKVIHFALAAFFSILLVISFNNCAGNQNAQQEQSSTAVNGSCDQVPDALRSPNSIAEAVNLINALPKPLAIDCFLKSLKKPLKVMAVNNAFSAQPAVKNESPRIFIVNTKLALSVAPAGEGRYLLELSEPSSAAKSFKAEIAFPIQKTIDLYEPLSRILDKTTGSSNCVLCHRNEEQTLYHEKGFAFNSDIVRPNEYQRVFSYFLRNQAFICDSATDKYRCDMLNAIFMIGEAQDSPFLF